MAEDDQTKRDLTESIKQRFISLRQDSQQFLIVLADKANFSSSKIVSMQEVAKELGISDEYAKRISDYLQAQYWVHIKKPASTYKPLNAHNKSKNVGDSLNISAVGLIVVEIWLEPKHTKSADKVDVIQKGTPLWEQIPDKDWDRQAVQLLHKGYSDPDIGKRLSISSKRVTNRLSELRRLFPEQVPTRKELRQRKIKSGE